MQTARRNLTGRATARAAAWSIGAAALLAAAGVMAAAISWDAGGGANLGWHYQSVPATYDNWNDDGSPAGDDVTFNNTGASATQGTVTNIVEANVSVASLAYTNSATNYHTTQIDAGTTLTVTGGMTVAPAAAGTAGVTIKGTTPGVGSLAISGGNFAIINPTLWASVSATLDLSGLGTFTANVGNFDINRTNPFLTATMRLAQNNTITATNLRMGRWGGGGNTGYLYLGQTNTLNCDNIYVGGQDAYNGTQSFILFDSGLTNPSVTIRNKAGNGRVNLISVGDRPTVDNPGDKVRGTLDFTGGLVDILVNDLVVGSAGGRQAAGNAEEAYGYLTLGAGTIDATTLRVGRQTKAGNWNNARGFLTINGGTVIADTMIIADQQVAPLTSLAYGTINLSGGTLRATTIQGGGDYGGSVTFNFNSGTLANKAGTDLLVGIGVPLSLLTASTHTIDLEAGRTATINSVISGAAGTGGIVKAGDGTLILNGNNSYTGATLVNAGILQVDGALTAITSTTTVASGGTLSGTGTVRNVTVQSGGNLAPGDSPGVLAINGNLLLQSGSNYLVEVVTGSAPGNGVTGYDQVQVAGTVTLTDANLQVFASSAGFGLQRGQILTIVANDLADPVVGTFSGLSEGANVLVGGVPVFTISYVGGTGNDVTLTALIPEPTTAVLLALGGLAFFRNGRRG